MHFHQVRSHMAILIGVVVLIAFGNVSVASENYEIQINGRTYDIGLDQERKVKLPTGDILTITLSLKEYVEYESDYFSFSHKGAYKANKSDLGDGIYQTILTTPLGNMVLVQEYSTMDPTPLLDLYMQNLTKEERDYGYTYEEKQIEKTVGNAKLRGKEAVLTYKGEGRTYRVYTFRGGPSCLDSFYP